MTEKCRQFA